MFDIIAYRRAQRPGGLAATNPGGNRAGIPGTGQSTQHHERRLSLADRRTFPRADVHQSAAARLQNVISSSAAPRLPGVIFASLHSNVNFTHGLDACLSTPMTHQNGLADLPLQPFVSYQINSCPRPRLVVADFARALDSRRFLCLPMMAHDGP